MSARQRAQPTVIEGEHVSTDDDRLRILLLIKGLGRGGAEQLVVNSALLGDRSRFSYEVAYLLPWKDAFVPELQASGIPVSCLDGGSGLTWIVRLKRLVRDRGIDLVHVHSPAVAALLRSSFGRSRPVLVTTEHNVWERYHPVTYWANAVTFGRNDHVFAVSEEVRASIRYPTALRILPTPPTETLHYGIDMERVLASPPGSGVREELGIPMDAPVVGTVANFKPHKGHEYLLKTAARVARERPDVRFVLVGSGPLEGRLREQARGMGLGDVVVFAGFREDPLRVMRIFDVLAVASVHEGLPLSLLEAMALGCPPVVTRVGGVSAAIDDGVSGFIVDPRDDRAQAERILAILNDATLQDELGASAKEGSSRFDVRRAIRRIEDVYEGLVA